MGLPSRETDEHEVTAECKLSVLELHNLIGRNQRTYNLVFSTNQQSTEIHTRSIKGQKSQCPFHSMYFSLMLHISSDVTIKLESTVPCHRPCARRASGRSGSHLGSRRETESARFKCKGRDPVGCPGARERPGLWRKGFYVQHY